MTITMDGGRDPGRVALRLRNISKSFGNFRALDSVDLDVHAGEVVALLGANGSGKSTLVKLLAGFHSPDPGGQVELGGRAIRLPILPSDSRRLGMSFVFQDLGLALSLSVHENLMIGLRAGHTIGNRAHLSWRREREYAAEILNGYGIDLDPRTVLADVAPVGRALLAIARAAEEQKQFRAETGGTSSVLVLDEPTVFLPESDCEFLYELVRSVTGQGVSVIFVSHDLEAVRKVAHSVTVLRNGRVSGQAAVADISDDALIDMIVGRQRAPIGSDGSRSGPLHRASASVAERPASQPAQTDQLQVRGLSGGRIAELDLTIRPGEVLGVAGLLGSGVEEIPYLLFGATPANAGTITVQDTCLRAAKLNPSAAMRAGIALVPADRAEHASVGTVSVEENMLLLVERQFFRKGWRRRGSIRSEASVRCESFDVRPRRPEAALGRLSGGNQQKVILAKWLEIAPRVVVLHEPTQGVDVGARADVYRLVQEATARTGACVLWVTTDFGELAQVCDRVLVVRNGRISDELCGDAVSRESISQAVFGSVDMRVVRCDEVFAQRQAPVTVSSVR